MTAPVVLILGAGPNIGHHVAATFAANGFRVASASRSKETKLHDSFKLDLYLDLAQSQSIEAAFAHVQKVWEHPSVVICNGTSRTIVDENEPFAMSLDAFNHEMAVNTTAAYLAAKLAVEGFKALPPSTKKTFIFTGNKLNVMPKPPVNAFSMGKSASSKMVWNASIAYKERGFKFYYVDERLEDGEQAAANVDGEAAGLIYHQLAMDPQPHAWYFTFVKGKGYTDFRASDNAKYW